MTTTTTQFGVKHATLYGQRMWWVCRRQVNGYLMPYGDIYAPTGYGFFSKARAIACAQEIERRTQRTDLLRKDN